MKKYYGFIILILSLACQQQVKPAQQLPAAEPDIVPVNNAFDSGTKTIHVLAALCDNKYQGIVPVPNSIGNGQDPNTNLYWGSANGIRSYFKKSKNWLLIKRYTVDSVKLERLVFKHKKENCYLVADA